MVFYLICSCVLLIFSWGRSTPAKEADGRRSSYLREADRLLGLRGFDSAVRIYDKLLDLNPDNEEARWRKEQAQKVIEVANALNYKGEEYLAAGQLDEAYDYFQQSRELFPYNPNDSYEQNKGVFELRDLQARMVPYINQLHELVARQEQIVQEMQNGEDVKSERITSMIEEIYDMAREVYHHPVEVGVLESTEAINYNTEKKRVIQQMKEELRKYDILPYMWSLPLDDYVQNVQIKLEVYSDGEGTIWDEYRLKHPDIDPKYLPGFESQSPEA